MSSFTNSYFAFLPTQISLLFTNSDIYPFYQLRYLSFLPTQISLLFTNSHIAPFTNSDFCFLPTQISLLFTNSHISLFELTHLSFYQLRYPFFYKVSYLYLSLYQFNIYFILPTHVAFHLYFYSYQCKTGSVDSR